MIKLVLFFLLLSQVAFSRTLPIERIKLPAGFKISIFNENVPGARSLSISPAGTVFVGTRDEGKVYAIKNNEVITIAQGLHSPNGVAFRNGALYVAEVNRVLRYDAIEANLKKPPSPIVVSKNFPSDESHGWKFIRFSPDGLLYVPIGAPCNVCEPAANHYASIMRMKPDGSNLEIFAKGIRNTVGFDWSPQSKELWFTDNGRDLLGDDVPPDELNRAPKAGMNFGFPYCHAGTIQDPEFGAKHKCSEFTAPELNLTPHGAALGMRFYNGSMFPAEYRNQIFIAEHGSWNRSVPIGYRVQLARIVNGKAVKYETFAEGWLASNGGAWGRPVDVEVMSDGSLLVSDDRAGAIYRITH